MYILNIAGAIRKMSVSKLRDFILENYYKRIGFVKGGSYYSMKHLKKIFVASKQINKKIPDPRSSKEHYQSFIRKKDTKLVKQSRLIIYQPNTLENPNTFDMKLAITKHQKTFQ